MDFRLRFEPSKAATWGAVCAAATAGAAYTLTALNPLHGAIYGLAIGIIGSMVDRTLRNGNYPLAKRAIEYIASSTLALACVTLIGITITAKTAVLLSGAALVAGASILLLNDALNDSSSASRARA